MQQFGRLWLHWILVRRRSKWSRARNMLFHQLQQRRIPCHQQHQCGWALGNIFRYVQSYYNHDNNYFELANLVGPDSDLDNGLICDCDHHQFLCNHNYSDFYASSDSDDELSGYANAGVDCSR